jgi:hypothetical protein
VTPTRREFLQTGLVASLLPWAIPGTALARHDIALDVAGIYKVVVDVSFAAGAAFADDAEQLGAGLVRITGDITDFWFHDLSLRWKQSPVPIAGLTAHGPLFCLERFAWDHGMRVVVRREHERLGNAVEPLISWVIAPVRRA